MTEKRCTDCRYTKGIGYDFWCGEGHTEYEVFGAETNCPYYEYYDWSKGVPSMTEKRFEVDESENQFTIFDNEGADDYYHLGNDERDVRALCKLMNELLEEPAKLNGTINQLKEALKTLGEDYTKLTEKNNQYKILTDELKRQNKKLKARLNDLGVEYYD